MGEIKETFQKTFPVCYTQTECILAAHFHLAKDPQAAADRLVELIARYKEVRP